MLRLPTDTAFLNPETRQYELFNVRLRAGVPRRQFVAGAAAGVVWLVVAVFVLRVWDWLPQTPAAMVTILPPVGAVWLGTRADDSGRMAAVGFWDRVLARPRARSGPVVPPLVAAAHPHRPPLVLLDVPTEIRIGNPPVSVKDVWTQKHRPDEGVV